jgi:hypothetical protein
MSLPNKHAHFNTVPNCVCARNTVDCHVRRLVIGDVEAKYALGCLKIYIAF